MGLYMAVLGLASLISLVLAPMLLTGVDVPMADVLAETNVMKVLIILWAGYAVGVGAHGLWEYDDRAIGFYSAFLTIVTVVALIYFAIELEGRYGEEVRLGLSAATFVLAVLSSMLFFYLAIPFLALRKVAGWFLLFGSIGVAGIGLAIVTTTIEVTT